MFRLTVVLSLFTLSAGCGRTLPAGSTDCGSQTCPAGQYCADARLEMCQNGCVSDSNCLPADTCVITDAFFAEGLCLPRDTADPGDPDPDPGTSATDTLGACQDACDHFQSCGLSASETAQCRSDCQGLSDNQRQAIANCDGTACSSAPSCLGVDCLSSSDCGGGEDCFEYQCL